MNKNVKYEKELYSPMCAWLKDYLQDNYKNAEIIVKDTSQVDLDVVLEQYGVLDEYPQTIGIGMQIDVLGIVKKRGKAELFFIEAKKEQLNTHHLGQILVYCRICNPTKAFLLSSVGLGPLEKLIHEREDILSYGSNKEMKFIQVSKWDIIRNMPDMVNIFPKI